MAKAPQDKVPRQASDRLAGPTAGSAAGPAGIDDVELMQYLDGEADEQTAGSVRADLHEDAGARARLEALEQVGETLRTHLELAADDVEPRLDAMWTTIERRIQSNGVSSTAAEPAYDPVVAPVPAGARARQRPRPRPGQRGGLWATIGKWIEAHRGHFVTGMVTAGAVAALVLVLRPPREVIRERIVERPVAVAPAQPREALVPVVTPPASTPPQVESLEVTDGSGSVFTIPGEDEDDAATTVIWLDLDDSEVEEPL